METSYDDLAVEIHPSPEALGEAVARQFADAVRARLQEQETVGVVLQSGSSQLSFIQALAAEELAWPRIEVFHLDEWVGLPGQHPVSFRRWINERIIEPFGPKVFHQLAGEASDPHAEARRYSDLLLERDPPICVMGIGDNGQLAYNDPPAEFHTLEPVIVVQLDEASRQHMARQGHFDSDEHAPRSVLTMSIPALLSRAEVLLAVPESRKAAAVQAALEGPITRAMPASALRTCPRARLHLDHDSAAKLSAA